MGRFLIKTLFFFFGESIHFRVVLIASKCENQGNGPTASKANKRTAYCFLHEITSKCWEIFWVNSVYRAWNCARGVRRACLRTEFGRRVLRDDFMHFWLSWVIAKDRMSSLRGLPECKESAAESPRVLATPDATNNNQLRLHCLPDRGWEEGSNAKQSEFIATFICLLSGTRVVGWGGAESDTEHIAVNDTQR